MPRRVKLDCLCLFTISFKNSDLIFRLFSLLCYMHYILLFIFLNVQVAKKYCNGVLFYCSGNKHPKKSIDHILLKTGSVFNTELICAIS